MDGGYDDGVSIAAESGERDDPVARRESDHVASDFVDLAGYLVANDHGRFWRVRVEAESGENVGEVDARRADADANVGVPSRGIGNLSHLEYVGCAEPRDHNLTHRQAGAYHIRRPAIRNAPAWRAALFARAADSLPGRTRRRPASRSPRRSLPVHDARGGNA